MIKISIEQDYAIIQKDNFIIKLINDKYESFINIFGKNVIKNILQITDHPIDIEVDLERQEIIMILWENLEIIITNKDCYYEEINYASVTNLKTYLQILELIENNQKIIVQNLLTMFQNYVIILI